jgi:hypothetical protein
MNTVSQTVHFTTQALYINFAARLRNVCTCSAFPQQPDTILFEECCFYTT